MEWKKKGKFWARDYKNYNEYVKHQQSKLTGGIQWLEKYDSGYRLSLFSRLCSLDIPFAGKSVLCLGARIGTEVKAFLGVGCFAVGIDLNPGQNNMFVLVGDFHDTIFPDESVDIVFTNSFDHVLYLDKFLSAIKKVLKRDGIFINEDVNQARPGEHGGPYECFGCDDRSVLLAEIKNAGFKLEIEYGFNNNIPGDKEGGKQMVFRVVKDIVKDYDLCL